MAISDTAKASVTLCTASTNRIIQTGTLNGLSFDFVLFCVSGLFSKSGTVRGSKKGGARVGVINTKTTLNFRRTKSVTM